ncbi:olfactory receptor 5P76-like [Loxodonta africana]|uniref:olfactory receptor 5P76-like n=1 Tax=Loxodonta africana TaxID=9785 RepID=UPI0030CFB756
MDYLVDGNHTAVTGFILFGLTEDPTLRVVLFMVSLCIYLVTISGNLSTIILIRISSQLHRPMYFFLSHLALADIGLSSSVTPNMLINFLVETNTISYLGCGIQHGSAAFFGTVEFFLLAAMAYDLFVAICNPLPYSTKMSTQVCDQLFSVAYVDVELSCSDVSIPAVVPSFSAGSIITVTLFIIVASYIYILIIILKMPSTQGRHKAFSTCTSQITAVTLYYGTVTFIYVMPKSSYSTDQNKVVSEFYMVVIPMLKPLIYSLRNNEIKAALRRQLGRKIFS